MSTSQPIYSDKYRSSLFQLLSPVIAAFVVVSGIIQQDALAIVLGLALGVFVWFTTHTKYELYPDRFVIYYGMPRRRVVPLADIEDMQLVKAPLQARGLLIRKGASRLLITPRDPDRMNTEIRNLVNLPPPRGPSGPTS